MPELSLKLFILYFSVLMMMFLASANFAENVSEILKKRKEDKEKAALEKQAESPIEANKDDKNNKDIDLKKEEMEKQKNEDSKNEKQKIDQQNSNKKDEEKKGGEHDNKSSPAAVSPENEPVFDTQFPEVIKATKVKEKSSLISQNPKI
jgi:hypothetical protein